MAVTVVDVSCGPNWYASVNETSYIQINLSRRKLKERSYKYAFCRILLKQQLSYWFFSDESSWIYQFHFAGKVVMLLRTYTRLNSNKSARRVFQWTVGNNRKQLINKIAKSSIFKNHNYPWLTCYLENRLANIMPLPRCNFSSIPFIHRRVDNM